jgi:hypothetical protein
MWKPKQKKIHARAADRYGPEVEQLRQLGEQVAWDFLSKTPVMVALHSRPQIWVEEDLLVYHAYSRIGKHRPPLLDAEYALRTLLVQLNKDDSKTEPLPPPVYGVVQENGWQGVILDPWTIRHIAGRYSLELSHIYPPSVS